METTQSMTYQLRRMADNAGETIDAERLSAAADAIEHLREYAFEVSKALTGLTVGGSEFFADGKLGFYKADIPACVKNVEWRMEQRAKLAVARALHSKEPKDG